MLPFGKMNGQSIYTELRSIYENFDKNDGSALPYVRMYIQKAQDEKNYFELKNAYEDYSSYSPKNFDRLKYADSAISAAKKTDDHELIASAYLYKGSLYYFYNKDYSAALDQYISAYKFSKDGRNEYLKHKIFYQMGLVKSYLGYYNEALEYFSKCIIYFESKTNENNHPNEVYNDSKGYLNSLHQAIVCYQHLKDYKNADSLISKGFKFTIQSKDFIKEKNYFLKCKGISEYHHKNYQSAIKILNQTLPILMKNDDAYWVSVSEFYVGKCYLKKGQVELAIKQFEKVDSIFKKRAFIFPELEENYELFISYYKKNKNSDKELAYTKDLLKVDSILKKDFPNLSSRIHRDYDNKILAEAKSKIESKHRWGLTVIAILIILVIILCIGLRRYYQNDKEIKQKYNELEIKISENKSKDFTAYENISVEAKSIISQDIFSDIQAKLKDFEENKGFKESGLTIEKLAETFSTNKLYLSQYINDTKIMNFSKYLSTLRINYITQLIYNNPKYLLLNIQGLADECGISSRTNFSNLFQEVNGMRPTDFIKQRRKELEEKNT